MIADAASQSLPAASGPRRAIAFAALAAGAYALALIVGLPARVALGWADAPGADEAAGTVWQGSVPLGPAVTATWRAAPLRSLAHLALAADLSVHGADTDLAGQAAWRPGRLEIGGLTGRAGWPLIAALAPKLPFACDLGLDVAPTRIVMAGRRSGASGSATSAGGACRSAGSTAVSRTPALIAAARLDDNGSSLWIAPAARRLDRLVEASVSAEGRLAVQVHRSAAALLPAGALAGPVTIETQL